jgi:hypothetical protein
MLALPIRIVVFPVMPDLINRETLLVISLILSSLISPLLGGWNKKALASEGLWEVGAIGNLGFFLQDIMIQ